MTISGIYALVSHGYRNSVVRRSLLMLCLTGPAFAINFFLYYVAAALLSPENFGIFYVAISTGNVLYSGSFVLNIVFTRHLVSVVQTMGEPAAHVARSRIEALFTRWGALGALVAALALSAVGKSIGIQSWTIIVLIVLDTYIAYIIDINRAVLQSLRRTLPVGGITLVWMTLRFLLAVVGMVLLRTSWGALLGIVIASLLVMFLCHSLKPSANVGAPRPLPPLPPLRSLVPVVVGYFSLIAVSNLDVLLAYMLLKDNSLGVYSASSVFPKGIVIVVTPLLQMLYPLMVGHEKALPDIRIIVQKSTGLILLISSAMALGVLTFSGYLCGGPWGLKLCQAFSLRILLISAVTLSALRALVLYQSARGRDLMALATLVPTAAYLWIAAASSRTVETVAIEFTIFSAVLLLYYGGLTFLAERRC